MDIPIDYSVFCPKNNEVVEFSVCCNCKLFGGADDYYNIVRCKFNETPDPFCPLCKRSMHVFDESTRGRRYCCNECNIFVTIDDVM